VAHATREADLVIGGVLIPGTTAPSCDEGYGVAHEEGSVIVDVAIDQGGCIETRGHIALRSQLCGGWRGSLLRHQYAGRGAAHLDAGAHQCHVPYLMKLANLVRVKRSSRTPVSAEGLNTGWAR